MNILYTTYCPKCNILKKKLKEKNIEFQENTNQQEMINMGLMSVPYLKVDDKLMDFIEANEWINKQ